MNDFYKFFRSIKEKFGFKDLPNLSNNLYVYQEGDPLKMEEKFRVDVTEEIQNVDDIYIYGWVIETSYFDKRSSKWGSWGRHYNNKLYYSKGSAIDAIHQIKEHSIGTDFRAVAMYNFKNNGYRTYIINKILKT